MKFFPSRLAASGLTLAVLLARFAAPCGAAPGWKYHASYAVKLTCDSNVYLQDTFVSPASAPARESSGILTASVALGVEHRTSDRFSFSTGYAADRHWFWSAPAENHTTHRLSLGLNGRDAATAWNFQSSLLRTDGSSDGPIYSGPGGAPAIGGAPVRDRRDALLTNATFKLVQTVGRWQVRPSAYFNYQDFDTTHRRENGCANYIDRREISGGVDLARELAPGTFLVAGYRVGLQQQDKLFGVDSPYDSHLQRFLVGFDGAPSPWLQLSLLGGPEIRRYAAGTAATFDRDERPFWIDASATLKLPRRQSLVVSFRRQALPSSSSVGIYDGSTWDFCWRGRFGERFSANAGLRLARADWMAPALRIDRIVTPSLSAACQFDQRRQAEIAWSFDDAFSRVPATSGREFHRHLLSVSFKQTL